MRQLASANHRLIPQSSAAHEFGKYKKEKSQVVRAPDVRENQALKSLLEAWNGFLSKVESIKFYPAQQEIYEFAFSRVRCLHYSSQDIMNFVAILPAFQDNGIFNLGSKIGLFLSALINCGKEQNYEINTHHLSIDIYYLGFNNTKNITIHGNVGAYLAYGMQRGIITMRGNVGDIDADTINGTVIVEGKATWIGKHYNGDRWRRETVSVTFHREFMGQWPILSFDPLVKKDG